LQRRISTLVIRGMYLPYWSREMVFFAWNYASDDCDNGCLYH